MHARAILPVLLLLASLLAACDRSPAAPPPAPGGGPRFVALSPAVAIILKDLGHERLIVGRHGSDLVLAPALPVCGDYLGVDYEALLRARPTHIFTQVGSQEMPVRLKELATVNGWVVQDSPQLTLEDIAASITKVDEVASEATTGEHGSPAGAELLKKTVGSWRRRGDFSKAGSVLLLGGVTPPAAFGPRSAHHQVLERIGGTPAITTGNAWIELDTERVLSLAPDAIVLVMPRPPRTPDPHRDRAQASAAAMEMLGPVAKLGIPAVRNGRVTLIDDPLCHTPSPAMAEFADELAAVLAEWSK